MFEIALTLHKTVAELEEGMTMGELAGWIEFLTDRNRRAQGKGKRLGTHRQDGDEEEVDPNDLPNKTPEEIARMFGASVVRV